jgi:hypothetical protein
VGRITLSSGIGNSTVTLSNAIAVASGFLVVVIVVCHRRNLWPLPSITGAAFLFNPPLPPK